MVFTENEGLYLIEDSLGNLKMGFSKRLAERLYDYRPGDGRTNQPSRLTADGIYWLLGIRTGTLEDERKFHASHASIAGLKEWYAPYSRGWCLLLLQPWDEPDRNNLALSFSGEGPLYRLVHHKTVSEMASLLSKARLNRRGAAVMLRACPVCHEQFGAVALRKHLPQCRIDDRKNFVPYKDGSTCTIVRISDDVRGNGKKYAPVKDPRNPYGRKGRPKEITEDYQNREPDAWKTCERCEGKGVIQCWQDGQPGLDYCPNCDGMKKIPLWYVPTKIKITVLEK